MQNNVVKLLTSDWKESYRIQWESTARGPNLFYARYGGLLSGKSTLRKGHLN